jgi:hypothetical protein
VLNQLFTIYVGFCSILFEVLGIFQTQGHAMLSSALPLSFIPSLYLGLNFSFHGLGM